MNYRQAVLLDAETATTAGTKEITKLGEDVISQILIQFKATNNGSTPTAHPAKCISNIELKDGSDVLWSLSGIQQQALQFFQKGRVPVDIISYIDNNVCVPMMMLNFGRWLWDEEIAFDPSRFRNPKLSITHNKASGGSAPDAATLEVVANVFDELKPTPIGFMSAKEYYAYSLTSSAYEYIDMPTDEVMRTLMVQSLFDDKQPWEQYNEIRISENNQKRIPFDNKTSDLLKYLSERYGRYNENIYCATTTSAVEHFCAPTYETHIVATEQNQQSSYPILKQSYGGTFDIKASAAGQVKAIVSGYAPHGAMAIPFGDEWDANKWYDVTKLKELELRIKAGSSVGSSSTCEVVTETLRRY